MKQRPTRRSIIGSAAVTLGLPYLASLGFSPTRRARAAECMPRKRFLAWFKPNGFVMPDWTPRETGKAWVAPPLLAPLEAIRGKVMVVSGLENQEVGQARTPVGDHAGGTGPFLNQIRVAGHFNDSGRTSVDQIIAGQVGACTALPSVQMGIDPSISAGDLDGAPTMFSRAISWSKGTPMPNLYAPDVVFTRLFAGVNKNDTDTDAQRRQIVRASVLDHVRQETTSLSSKLAQADRAKLDEYLTGVRALETRIQKLSGGSAGGGQCPVPAMPAGRLPFQEHVDAMIDLMALAFQCDSTRITTFMLSQASSTRTYEFLGTSGGYHLISHHQSKKENLDMLRKIGVWQVQRFVDLMRKLDAIDDGGGRTVLDNTLAFFSTDVSDGDAHNHWDLPVLLAGGLGGAIKGLGEHVKFANYTFPRPLVGPKGTRTMGDLFLAFLRGFGIQQGTFGENGKNPLTEILT